MLKATIQTKIARLPDARGDDFPLPEGTIHLPQSLRLEGTPEDPDVFDLEDRITLHTADDSPQQRGRRYAALEEMLAEYPGIQRLEDDEAVSGEDTGETTNSQEGDE